MDVTFELASTGCVDGGRQDVDGLLIQLDAAGRREPEDFSPDLRHTSFEPIDRPGLSGDWSTSLTAGPDSKFGEGVSNEG